LNLLDLLPVYLRLPVQWIGDHPLLVLALIAGLLSVLASRWSIYPNNRFWALILLPFLMSVLVFFYPDIFVIAAVIDLLVFLVATCDLFLLPATRKFSVEREVARTASIAKDHPITLTIINRSHRHTGLHVKDDLPQEFETDEEEFYETIPAQSRMTIKYDVRAKRRGRFYFEKVYIRFSSLLGFWKKLVAYDVRHEVNVYPDLKQLGEYAILARKNKLSLMGLRRTRRIGQDNEFERLRDYTTDDNFKHIDWRTTARRNKLTVRDFQANQSQRVIFLLDCGRMMTNTSSGLNLLDHALNATLMLSYIALQKGDAVGLICFSDRIHTYVPPRGGMGQMNQLLHAMFDRDPALVESRYDQAFLYLATHCLRRSLVVLISNVIDEVNSMQIEQYLTSIVGRHLPIGVLLRDHRLFDIADREPATVAEVYDTAVAAEILSWRHQVLVDLEHKGVMSLDVFPEDMTAPLINRYLEIKARHLL
jgi:uncharacterized protein (DUF58 family)